MRWQGGAVPLLLWLTCCSAAGAETAPPPAPPTTTSDSNVRIGALSVEHLANNPVGIATLVPRFSWELLADTTTTSTTSSTTSSSSSSSSSSTAAAVRGVQQHQCHVLVASSLASLLSHRGDLWDATLTTNQSTLVPYNGSAPLVPGARYFWKVRVAVNVSLNNTTNTQWTPWSTNAHFTIGLQQRSDWDAGARFIGMAEADNASCPWLETRFTLPALPAGAAAFILHVASIGYHEAYIDRRRVAPAWHLLPSTAFLAGRVRTVAYDVTSLLESNESSTLALWLAPGWAMFSGGNPAVDYNLSKYPLVQAELRVSLPGGVTKTILTTNGGTWTAALSNTSHLGSWHNSNFGGDRVVVGDSPVGDAVAATEYDIGARLVSAECLEPNGIVGDPISPVRVSRSSPSTQLITMAELYSGWLRLDTLRGPPNSTVTIQFSSNAGAAVEFTQQDEVVLDANGCGWFQNRFSYHEVLYVTVTGLSQPLDPNTIHGLRIGNLRTRRGSFSSTNTTVNAIYDAAVRTYIGLTTGGMTVDCPHRERLGYGGDAHTTLEMALATFDSGAFFTKWMEDWRDVHDWWQTKNASEFGRLPHTAPTVDGGGGPGWGGIAITMPLRVYQRTGDTRIVSDSLDVMLGEMDFWLRMRGADGLVETFGGSWGFLGDWLTPHGSEESNSIEAKLFNNCYIAYSGNLLAGMLEAYGGPARAPDAARIAGATTALRQAIHKQFYRGNGTYLDTRQTHLVMPLFAGVPPPSEEPAVMAALVARIRGEDNGHIDTGLHGTYFLSRILAHMDKSGGDLLYEMAMQPTAPSYRSLLSNGFTTFPEAWDGNSGDKPQISHMHGTLNGIGLWFPAGLGGVQLPGVFGHIEVHPQYGAGGLRGAEAAAVVGTGGVGVVRVAWTLADGGGVHVNISVPLNARVANMTILTRHGEGSVTECGDDWTGVQVLAWLPGGVLSVALGSGDYCFAPTAESDPESVVEEALPAPAANVQVTVSAASFGASAYVPRFWGVAPLPDAAALACAQDIGKCFWETNSTWLQAAAPAWASHAAQHKGALTFPFASNLSAVRILGGWATFHPENQTYTPHPEHDLVFRTASGALQYAWARLDATVDAFLGAGVTPSPIVLDNVPFCFVQKPTFCSFGQSSPPDNATEFAGFVQDMVRHLVTRYGEEMVGQWSFRLGTEANGPRFGPPWEQGGLAAYQRVYEPVARAVQAVLPSARFGPSNMAGVTVPSAGGLGNCTTCPYLQTFLSWVRARRLPLDFVALSEYSRVAPDGLADSQLMCGPPSELKAMLMRAGFAGDAVPLAVHEFGWANWLGPHYPWPTGAYGGAWTLAAWLWLRSVGVDDVFHWEYFFDSVQGRTGAGQALVQGDGWALAAAERLVGGWGGQWVERVARTGAAPAENITVGGWRVSKGSGVGGELVYVLVSHAPNRSVIDTDGAEVDWSVVVGDADFEGGQAFWPLKTAAVQVAESKMWRGNMAGDLMWQALQSKGGYPQFLRGNWTAGGLGPVVTQTDMMATDEGLAWLGTGGGGWQHWVNTSLAAVAEQPFDGEIGEQDGGLRLRFRMPVPGAVVLRISSSSQ